MDAKANSDAAALVVDELNLLLAPAIARAKIETPRRNPAQILAEAHLIFRELFDVTGDLTEAQEAAVAWPLAHPLIYGKGPAFYIDGWLLYRHPHLWRRGLC